MSHEEKVSNLSLFYIIKTEKCQVEQTNTSTSLRKYLTKLRLHSSELFYYVLLLVVTLSLYLLYMFGGHVILNGLLLHLSLQHHGQ